MKKNITYRISLSAILCALAITLTFAENLLPAVPFLPPGAKPGLSNIITMFVLDLIGLPYAITITAVKGGFVFITRGATAAIMSLSGGIPSALAMFLLFKISKDKIGIAGISVTGALIHNFGQLIASVFISGSKMTLGYAPALAIFGLITGILTGSILKAIYPAIKKIDYKNQL